LLESTPYWFTSEYLVCSYWSIARTAAAAAADRYVLLGNHRDAWVFGAVDPTSATAVMMEVSRALARLVTEGQSVLSIYHYSTLYFELMNKSKQT